MRTKPILTKATLARIPAMVASGAYANRQAIAEALGCKLPTLQVRCSQNGISLRCPGTSRRGRPPGANIRLDHNVINLLREHAAKSGENEHDLARRLIETIARDDLFDAVLDDKEAA